MKKTNISLYAFALLAAFSANLECAERKKLRARINFQAREIDRLNRELVERAGSCSAQSLQADLSLAKSQLALFERQATELRGALYFATQESQFLRTKLRRAHLEKDALSAKLRETFAKLHETSDKARLYTALIEEPESPVTAGLLKKVLRERELNNLHLERTVSSLSEALYTAHLERDSLSAKLRELSK